MADHHATPQGPGHARCGGSAGISDLTGLGRHDLTVLMIARYFFQSFAHPQSEGWLRAMSGAEQVLGPQEAPEVVFAVLRAVQEMRHARRNPFNFSNPDCPGCAARLCGHERLFLNIFRAMRRGRQGDAEAHALLLCEGNGVQRLIAAMGVLAAAMPGVPLRPSAERQPTH
ncbi:hypothetical protein [Salipiger sp. PrR002]|uniref:hypothetical protein n=1 Tax=Salipiger sp. PrR002 TaxID=2706489 RepID=UPI0013B8BCF7|nr:hypothetical protein [Salipiger sp. PrR002]NDW00921.1 hypothetical protein [Salipiger sp. PrR002]NDW56468.1 hypothetical protein [Salipiger sp. PrR004]